MTNRRVQDWWDSLALESCIATCLCVVFFFLCDQLIVHSYSEYIHQCSICSIFGILVISGGLMLVPFLGLTLKHWCLWYLSVCAYNKHFVLNRIIWFKFSHVCIHSQAVRTHHVPEHMSWWRCWTISNGWCWSRKPAVSPREQSLLQEAWFNRLADPLV